MNGNRRLDEREMKILSQGMAASVVVGMIYEIMLIIYKLMTTPSTKAAITEISILGVMVIGTLSYYIVTSEYVDKSGWSKEYKKTRRFILDERQRKHISESLAAGAFFGYFYTLFVIIFKFIRDKGFKNTYLEISLIVIMAIVLNLYHRKAKEFRLPKTIRGKELSIGSSPEEKKIRYKNYLLDALVTSMIFIPIDIITKRRIFLIVSDPIYYLLSFFFRLILFFIINLIWGECNIKHYNKYYGDLFDEE